MSNQISLTLWKIQQPPDQLREIVGSIGSIRTAGDYCMCGGCSGFVIRLYHVIVKRGAFGRGEARSRKFAGWYCSECGCWGDGRGDNHYCEQYLLNLPHEVVAPVYEAAEASPSITAVSGFRFWRDGDKRPDKPEMGTIL